MSNQIIYAASVVIIYLLVKYLNSTDTPKIKGLPEIPGVPIFGNLYQLGTDHARVAQKWAAKYGPVFQTRLGNRVCGFDLSQLRPANNMEARHLCQFV